MSYFLAVDLGTTGCRSIIFDEKTNICASSYEEYALVTEREGYAEQDALDWWRLTLSTARAAIQKSGIDPLAIKSIGVSSQGITVVPVDEKIEPLRPALTWLDLRATEETARIRRDFGERLFEITGKPTEPDYTLPKILWLMENEPEIYNRAYKLLLPSDFLVARLTGGVCVTDESMASGTLMYDLAGGKWCSEILEKYGIDENKLSSVRPAAECAGRVCPEAARALGLSPECRVAVSAQDQKCAAYGVGLDFGSMTVSLGTAAAVTKLWDEPKTRESRAVGWCGYVKGGLYVTEGVIDTAATCLRYVRDLLFAGLDYDEINKEALAARERGSSLLFFPYLAEGRGGFVGVSLASVRGDYALSVMEGVAFRLRSLLAAMDAYGSVSRLILFGGGAKGELWCQIIADVTGMTIAVPNTTEAAGAGAARLAADAVGDSLPPLEIARVYEPGERADYYREKYERYIKTEKRLFEEEN